MLKRFSATKKDGTQSSDDPKKVSIDELVTRIRQLVRHHGYDRTKITSARLKSYLPIRSEREWQGESLLRKHHATAQLDRGTLVYLVENVHIELQMAHERQTG